MSSFKLVIRHSYSELLLQEQKHAYADAAGSVGAAVEDDGGHDDHRLIFKCVTRTNYPGRRTQHVCVPTRLTL